MPKLIRTLKRILPPQQPSESPKAKAAAPAPSHNQKNDLPALIYYSQLREADGTAATTTVMNKISSSAPSYKATSPADSSAATTALMNSYEITAYSDRNRKRESSSVAVDDDLARGSAPNKKQKLCSAEGCTNIVIQGGVCIRHGAKRKERKRCSREGCTNQAQIGEVCIRHGAKKRRYECSAEECTNLVVRGGVCWRHGAKTKSPRCSSEGCRNQAQCGGVCIRHSAKVTRSSAADYHLYLPYFTNQHPPTPTQEGIYVGAPVDIEYRGRSCHISDDITLPKGHHHLPPQPQLKINIGHHNHNTDDDHLYLPNHINLGN